MSKNRAAARDVPKSDRVYAVLRGRIRDTVLAPGALLAKEAIAVELGVSRAPVSEALARLAEEGLVEIFPQHGSFVAEIRESDVREALFLREALEVEAVRRCAGLMDQELCALLESNLDAESKALRARDLKQFYELDEALHERILAAIGFARVAKLLDAARAALDRMRRLTLPKGERASATLREHRWIVEAIRSGDPEFAGAAMRAHLNAVSAAIEEPLRGLSR
jgi:DNA-binding GntR family transcriptional regulator